MIVGTGLIATSFRAHFGDDPEVLVFASGVSNSRETRPEEFARERHLLEQHLGGERLLLYFSTCSVADLELMDSPYVRHKLQMEALVRGTKRFAIFRLPQVVGRTPNPNTVTNFLCNKVRAGEPFQVWRNARRNLIDIDDVTCIVRWLLQQGLAQGRTIDVASPFYTPVAEIVRLFEQVLGREARCTMVEAGGSYAIDTSLAEQAAARCGVRFDEGYVRRLIEKYYGQPQA